MSLARAGSTPVGGNYFFLIYERFRMNRAQIALVRAYQRRYRVRDNTVYGLVKKQPLSLQCSDSGYLYFGITIQGKNYRVFLHRLVAYEKYGDELFTEGTVVRHLNGDSQDNAFANICLGTQSQNMLDRAPRERLDHAIKAAATNRKFSNAEVETIRSDYSKGLGYKALMAKYSISSKGTLHHILKHRYIT